MLRRSSILLLVVVLDILWGLAAGGRFVLPHFTLMYLVARTIHGFDYTTPLCAFALGFMVDAPMDASRRSPGRLASVPLYQSR